MDLLVEASTFAWCFCTVWWPLTHKFTLVTNSKPSWQCWPFVKGSNQRVQNWGDIHIKLCCTIKFHFSMNCSKKDMLHGLESDRIGFNTFPWISFVKLLCGKRSRTQVLRHKASSTNYFAKTRKWIPLCHFLVRPCAQTITITLFVSCLVL